MQAHGLSFSVPGTPAAAAAARRRVMSDLRSWSVQFDAQSLQNVELVTSELITNAVQHAGGDLVAVSARLHGEVLLVEVFDTSAELPSAGFADLDDEGGRGLFLVAALSANHGAERTPTGKRCWAEIPVGRVPRTGTRQVSGGSTATQMAGARVPLRCV
ncbi:MULTISPECIES: ATP-binding protein [Streptomyces]|uniref:Histidine kinase/HSP90-like ATPase domain-containing protein n=1 Tax=Streptomyces olivaceiscleroticus TaxID=68245 RepID=A0ABN0ZZI8_9ACTN|nr:ATP-binding protein [Streptomyces niger]